MSLSLLLNRPCTIVRRLASGTKDAHGREIPAEEDVATVCEIQQRSRRETGDEGEVSDTFWSAYFPAGTVLNTGDAVIVDGLGQFELVGDPWHADTGSFGVAHVEATVRRTRGPEDGS